MVLSLETEQLDISDHADAGLLRLEHGPVRHRMRQRHPGREHQRGEALPGHAAQIGRGEAGTRGLRHAPGVVIASDDIGAAGAQCLAVTSPEPLSPTPRQSYSAKVVTELK